MGTQEIITYAILVACLLWIGRHIYQAIRQIREHSNPCANCASGCELQRMLKEKQQQCKGKAKKKKKKLL